MATPKQSETLCVSCGHTESQHGTTGSRPCLAMSGDLVAREFCVCDHFSVAMPKAA